MVELLKAKNKEYKKKIKISNENILAAFSKLAKKQEIIDE